MLHQATAARIFTGDLGDGLVVFVDALIQLVGVREHVAHTAVGPAGQVFQMRTDLVAQPLDLLRQNDAELGDQAANAVVQGGAFFDKALPGTMQGECGLLVFILDRHEAHLRTRDGFADRGGIGSIVLATLPAHPVSLKANLTLNLTQKFILFANLLTQYGIDV